MGNTSSSSSSGGVGFLGLLTIVFVTLKLLDKIDWSWWWVTAPMWGLFGIFLAIGVMWLGWLAISTIIKSLLPKRKGKK